MHCPRTELVCEDKLIKPNAAGGGGSAAVTAGPELFCGYVDEAKGKSFDLGGLTSSNHVALSAKSGEDS